MQITISATLTNEQAIILAKRMGYSETIPNIVDGVDIGQINPQTPGEFIKEVYEKMVINDAIKHFIAYNDEKNQAIWEAEDEAIKNEIITTVTSQIIN